MATEAERDYGKALKLSKPSLRMRPRDSKRYSSISSSRASGEVRLEGRRGMRRSRGLDIG